LDFCDFVRADSSPPETISVIRYLLVTYQRRHQRYPPDPHRQLAAGSLVCSQEVGSSSLSPPTN
jgi:hypothetical protein